MAQSALAPRTAPGARGVRSRRSDSRGGLAHLLAGVSIGAAALALSLAPGAVRAASSGQAVNGTPTVQFGVGSITRSPTLDTVTVNAKEALIDWASNDPNVYLPVAKTLQFTGVNGAPYTVLNRVDAVGPLQINGTVASDTGGSVWFYNPGGWVVGSTGVFNVGSLVLSASPVAITAGAPDGQHFVDGKGAIHFTQAQSGASVTVQSGAAINANGSYVALIAPRVVQGGTVTTNGSTAYVGAEAATLTVNNGLFDITVDTGTTDANGVVHTGTTTGAAASANGPAHQIALVAVPKNQVLTMLVSGNLGYTSAVTASGQVDGTIVLGAGYNVTGGAVGTTTLVATGGSATLSALTTTNDTRLATSDAITVDASGSSVRFGKNLLGSAFNAINVTASGAGHSVSVGTDLVLQELTGTPSRTIALNATSGGVINVGGKTDLFNANGPGTGTITINAASGGGLTFGGDLGAVSSTATGITLAGAGSKLMVGGAVALRSSNSTLAQVMGTTGGTITISATGGSALTIGRSLDVRADASGGVTLDPANPAQLLAGSVGVAATAGSITATNTGSTFTVGGGTTLQALAYGGIGAVSDGAAQTGPVSFTQSGAGARSSFGAALGGQLTLITRASSVFELLPTPGLPNLGASASTGAATLSVSDGSFAAQGITIEANAITGPNSGATPFAATAGAASATFTNGSYTAGNLLVSNSAYDYNDGVVTAGKAALTLNNATLNLAGGFLEVDTRVHGAVTTPGGAAISLTSSNLTAANGLYASSVGEEPLTGAAKAPDLSVMLVASSLTTANVTLQSSSRGGQLSADATGGLAALTLTGGSNLTTTSGGVFITSDGQAREFGTRPDNGGVGTGGIAQFSITDSTATLAGDLTISASGESGDRVSAAGSSARGIGGSASVLVSGANAALIAGSIAISATGQPFVNEGPSQQIGGGTSGTGGSSQFTVTGGATVKANGLTVKAIGIGSDAFNAVGAPPAKGGSGTGGTATLTIDGSGGTIVVPTVKLDTSGYGGSGANLDTVRAIAAGDGGVGRGGTSTLNLFGGGLTTSSLTLVADGNQPTVRGNGAISYAGVGGGVSGTSSAIAGAGGAGFGGTSTLNVNGGTLSGAAPVVQVSAFGQGGLGGPATSGGTAVLTRGAGGAGNGGSARLSFDAGSIAAQRIAVDASAAGGNGGSELGNLTNPTDTPANAGAGGNATGGNAVFEVSQTFTSPPAVQAISVSANGVGAAGLAGVTGGAGGNGSGGFADFEINGSTSVSTLTVRANGTGGAGGASTLANAGAGGGGGNGGTARVITDFGASGTLTAAFLLSALGTGGAGGTGGSGSATMALAGNGGPGGVARGGSAIVEADGGSALTVVQSDAGSLIADATGGRGGSGGDAGRFGFAQRGNGAKGGDASGGSIEFIATGGSTIDLGDANYAIRTTGGAGGEAVGGGPIVPQPSLGGVGGRADFGEIRLSATDTGSTIKATSLTLNASAGGGHGGDGYGTDPITGNGTPGAVGGDASSARISLLADAGGAITIAPAGSVTLNAIATGGDGGNASSARNGTGGAGGRGGDGAAGFDAAVTVQTGTDAAIAFGANVTSAFSASGSGGRGGNGGAGASNAAVGGNGGNGGDAGTSGSGFGGAIGLVANGGTITTGDLALTAYGVTAVGLASGQGGAGGAGGPGRTIPPEIMGQPPVIIPPGANGSNGGAGFFSPVGGTVAITAADDGGVGSAIQYGTLSLGNVNAMVTSQARDIESQFIVFSGSIALKDTTNAIGKGFYAQSLTFDAGGFSDISPVGLTLLSINHPITVTDSVTVNADGTVQFTGQQGGGLTAGGTMQLYSNRDINLNTQNGGSFNAGTINLTAAGNIRLSSAGCPTPSCVVAHADGNFTAQSYNNQFILSGPAQVEGLNSISVTTGTDILGDHGSGYLSNNDVTLVGAGNVQVRNATAASLSANAGATNSGGGFGYDGGTLTIGEDDGSGKISTHNQQSYSSGGFITVPGGNALSAGLGITFASANDIVIGQNAAITANGLGSDTPGGVAFNAGSIVPNTPLAAGDIASLLIGSGAKINAGAGAVTLSAAAIDARGASFKGATFTADVTNDRTLTANQSTDGGQLSAPCREADICLGAVTASGAVRIGASETVPLHFFGTDPIAGGTVSVFTKGALGFGTTGQLTTITSPGAIRVSSQQGDVTLTGASLTGANVDVSAGGSLLGNGRITATGNDIGISVKGDIVADALSARQLTASGLTGDPLEPLFTTPGSFMVNTLTLKTSAAIQAGGNIGVEQANLGGNALSLAASGRTSLVAAGGVTNLTLAGQTVDFGTIATTGFFNAKATMGLTGTSAAAGTAFTGSGSTIAIPTVTSGTDTTLNGGAMTLGTIDAKGNLAITASGAVSLNRGTAAGALAITADALTAPLLTSGGNTTLFVTKAATLGTVKAGGDIVIDPTVLSFTALTSAGSTKIVSGDVLGGTIDAGASITIDATGQVLLDRATAATTLAIGAATITTPALTSGGAMTLTSSGQATLGTVNSGAGVQIAAAPLAYGTITAAGPVAITATSVKGGAITSSRSSLTINSPGAVTTGVLSSATDTTIAASALNFTSLNAGGSAVLTATSVSSSPIAAGQDVSVTSGTALSFQTVNAARNATLIAQIGNVTVSSDLAVGGTASAAGDAVTLTAKGPLSIATIVARGGDITVVAGGALAVSDGQAIGNVSLTTLGALTLGKLAAGYKPTAPVGNINGGSATNPRGPGNITLSAPTSFSATGTIDAAAALTATTNGAISLGALTTANTIALTSSDLALGATAQLGQARTTSVSLTNNGSNGMVLGDGFDTLGGYLVSNAEFALIHSGGSLTIDAGTAPAASPGTTARLTIGTLAASAATGTTEGNVASAGTLTLRSGNGVAVLGAATFANAAGNTLAISASGDVMIDATRGSLRLLEGSGHGGTLSIGAVRVLAVTPQALTDISGATSTSAITTRLSASDGVVSGATLLEAGTLNVTVSKGFYVQNTAALTGFDDRRGFLADSLTVAASGTAPITIVANGLVNGLSGLKAIPLATLPNNFDPQSSLNGCVILAVATCNQPVGFTNPIQDVIGKALGGPGAVAINSIPSIDDGFFNAPLMTLNQIAPLGFAPLIDEPVTGTGNDDLAGELSQPQTRTEPARKKARKHGSGASPQS